MSDRQVTRCGDCPLVNDYWEHCMHDYCTVTGLETPRKTLDPSTDGPPPDWCPLRSGPITIRLRSTADE